MVHSGRTTAWCVTLLSCAALVAQEQGTAVLFSTGTVFLNGAPVSNSSAVTPGDVIQTKETGAANVNAPGYSVVIESNSIVRYRGEGFALDRGNISLATGKGISIFARDFKITPAANGWTEFYVTRANGSIGIIARKNSVTVNCGAGSTTVAQGQQLSREDAANCGLVTTGHGAAPAAKGPIITAERATYGALGLGGVLTGWALATHNDNPVSPDTP
jgi:hypothetical protein